MKTGQHEWNKWFQVKEIIGPENYHSISQACTLAAKQFREDAKACAGIPRLVEQFESQAERCEAIAHYLEL
jgi:hypothetical protein